MQIRYNQSALKITITCLRTLYIAIDQNARKPPTPVSDASTVTSRRGDRGGFGPVFLPLCPAENSPGTPRRPFRSLRNQRSLETQFFGFCGQQTRDRVTRKIFHCLCRCERQMSRRPRTRGQGRPRK